MPAPAKQLQQQLFQSLNKAQSEAVFHTEGPCLVIAGPGTGKTKTLTSRILYLVKEKEVLPKNILAVTFTEKAAEEMRERVDQMMDLGYEEVNIATFHGLCDQILRERGFEIGIDPQYKLLSKSEQYAFVKQRLYSYPLEYYRPMGNPTKFIDFLLSYFSRLKDEDISFQQYQEWAANQKTPPSDEEKEEFAKHKELAQVYQAYQESLMAENAMDFNDLIFNTLHLLRSRPSVLAHYQEHFQYILVDEFQDTNYAQSLLMYMLAEAHTNIMVVGDDDQSIYRFRGASVSNILQFEGKFADCKKIVLNENYRSKQEILDLSYASIQENNPDRLEAKEKISKKLIARGEFPQIKEPAISMLHFASGIDEADYVSNQIIDLVENKGYKCKDIALLMRSNASMDAFTSIFQKKGIPFHVSTRQSLFDQLIIKQLLSVLNVLIKPYNDIAWFSVLTMQHWNIPMEKIIEFVHEIQNESEHIWKRLKDFLNSLDKNETPNFHQLFRDLMEYSRDHSPGEVLYKFVDEIGLFQVLQNENTQESNASITYISQLFDYIKSFQEQKADARIGDFLEYLNLIQETRDIPAIQSDLSDEDSVSLLTAHSSKGLEFPIVFIPYMVKQTFPTQRRAEPFAIPEELIQEILPEGDFHIQEERRLFYVACTRAKEKIYFTWSDSYSLTSKRKRKISPFLEEILAKAPCEIEEIHMHETASTEESLEATAEVTRTEPKYEIKKASYSQLESFKSCPRKYQYQYIYKIPQKPSAALSFGITLHATLNKFYKLVDQYQKREEQPALLPEMQEELQALSLETLLQMYEESWIPYGYDGKGHMNTRKKRGEEMLTEYYEKFKDYFGQPLFLEKSFTLPVGPYKIGGRFDRVDSVGEGSNIVEIFDYKTGRIKTQKDVDKDLQLSIYALAAREVFKKEVEKLSLYFLDGNQKIETTRSDEQLEKAKEEIIKIIDEINSSNFAPKPNKIMCKYCDYRSICDAAM